MKELRIVKDGKPGHSLAIGTYNENTKQGMAFRNFTLCKKAKAVKKEMGGEIQEFKR